MAVAVVNTQCIFNEAVEKTANAATATVADASEVFTITLTKADYKSVIEISNVSGSDGTLTYSFAAGDLWAKAEVTGEVAQGETSVIEVEGGKVMQDDATILLTLTPADGKILLTDHEATVQVVQTL